MPAASFEVASPYLPVDGRQVGGNRRLPFFLCLGVSSIVCLVLIRGDGLFFGAGSSSALDVAPHLVSQTVSGTYSLRVSMEYRDGTTGEAVQEGYKTLALDETTGQSYKKTQLSDGSGRDRILVTIEDPTVGRAIFFANFSYYGQWHFTCESFPMTGPRWPPEWTGNTVDRARRSNNSECLSGAVACERSTRAVSVAVSGDAAESLSTFRRVLHEDVWSEWPKGDRVPGSAKRKTEDVTWAQDERGALSSVRKRVDVALVDPVDFWNASEAFARLAVSTFNVTDATVGAPDASLFELPSDWGPCTGGDADVEPGTSMTFHT